MIVDVLIRALHSAYFIVVTGLRLAQSIMVVLRPLDVLNVSGNVALTAATVFCAQICSIFGEVSTEP